MAAAAKTKTAPAPTPAGFSLKRTIFELFAVTMIAAGAGALLSTLTPLAPTAPPHTGNEPVCDTASTNLLDLPPIVTNLGSPGDTWVRLEASIVFDAKALPHPEVVAAEIATDELAYLRTVALSQLEGPIGLANIRQDLNERAAIRSGGKVSELIVRALVVQ